MCDDEGMIAFLVIVGFIFGLLVGMLMMASLGSYPSYESEVFTKFCFDEGWDRYSYHDELLGEHYVKCCGYRLIGNDFKYDCEWLNYEVTISEQKEY